MNTFFNLGVGIWKLEDYVTEIDIFEEKVSNLIYNYRIQASFPKQNIHG